MKMQRFDGHDFYYEEGMPQIDLCEVCDEKPIFGNTSEKIICDLIVNNIQNDWNFADIGSHFGQFAMIAAKRTKGNVYCFEPVEDIYEVLKMNCTVFENMIPYNTALYNCKGNGSIDRSKEKYGGKNVLSVGAGNINVDTLDNFDFDIQMINIDVEGAGDKVLSGALKTLKKTKLVIFEKHPEESEYTGILRNEGFVKHDTQHKYVKYFTKD